MATALQGRDLKELQGVLLEHFDPGEIVEIVIGLPRELSDQELHTVAAGLSGLSVNGVEQGYTDEWQDALRFVLLRPSRPAGVAALPLVTLIIAALGAVGIAGILGWKVGNVVEEVGKNLLPLALIAGATFIIYALVTRKEGR